MSGARHLLPRVGFGIRVGVLDLRSIVRDCVLRLIPEQLLHTLANVVHHVVELGNAVVHLRLPQLEIRLRRLHLLHGLLEIGDPLRVLGQQSQDLSQLFLG